MMANSGTQIKLRGTDSPFAYFCNHFCNQVRRSQPEGFQNMDLQKLASERWKGMSASEKRAYKDMCDAERQQQEPEAAQHGEDTKGLKKRKRSRKAAKDPNAPKRATTAFFFFAQEERHKVREAHPEYKVTEVSKELGKMWGAMQPEAKEKFERMAVQDRERYQMEMEEYSARTKRNRAQVMVNEGSEDYSEDE